MKTRKFMKTTKTTRKAAYNKKMIKAVRDKYRVYEITNRRKKKIRYRIA